MNSKEPIDSLDQFLAKEGRLDPPDAAALEELRYPGANLPGDPALRQTPRDPAALSARCVERYTKGVLIESGFFWDDEQHKPVLIGELQNPSQPLLLMRETDGSRPYSLISAAWDPAEYCVAELLLNEIETRRRLLAFEGALPVADELADMLAWRQLGLAAVPLGRLADYDSRDQQEIAQKLAAVKPPPRSNYVSYPSWELPDPPVTAMLIVADWDPRTFDRRDPDRLEGTVEALLKIQANSATDLGGIGLWQPPTETLGKFKEVALHGKPDELARDLLTSLRNHVLAAGTLASVPDASLAGDLDSLGTALANAGKADGIRTHSDFDRLAAQFQLQSREVLCRPLERLAAQERRPERAVLWRTLSDAQRLLDEIVVEEAALRFDDGAANQSHQHSIDLRLRILQLQFAAVKQLGRRS
jgi:hypothetical protein